MSVIPEEMDDYEQLKTFVLRQNQKSKELQIEEALGECHLEGRKPAQFLRDMKSKLEGIGLKPNDDILKARLLQAMPQQAQISLTGPRHLPLQDFASVADSIFEIIDKPSLISHVTANNAGFINTSLEK